VAEAARRTTSRRALARHAGFEQVSPEVGCLDDEAFAEQLAEDPDEALALLADLTGATDTRLRELARRLAGRVVVDVARRGPARRRGVGRMRLVPADRSHGELDPERALDAVAAARATGGAPALDELRSREWARSDLALCLLVDRSGSMGGERLATAAVAAAACLWRAPEATSVVAFGDEAVVLDSPGRRRSAEEVVDDLFALRGHGPTDLALGLRTARRLLDRASGGARRVTILLSDGRATKGDDPLPEAAALDELVVLAPAGDCEQAGGLAEAVGGRWARVEGPGSVPEAVAEVLGDQPS
jgi:Mg-chelatase subunit ChlD